MRLKVLAIAALLAIGPAAAQNSPYSGSPNPDETIAGMAQNIATVNGSVTITTGGTFQQILPSIIGDRTQHRQSLTIQNNNANSTCLAAGNCQVCYVFIGSGTPTAGTSITLAATQAYTRFFPYVPSDKIQATCDNTNATLYVDSQ